MVLSLTERTCSHIVIMLQCTIPTLQCTPARERYDFLLKTAAPERVFEARTPASPAVQAVGRIVANPHLGGLHHQYVRICSSRDSSIATACCARQPRLRL